MLVYDIARILTGKGRTLYKRQSHICAGYTGFSRLEEAQMVAHELECDGRTPDQYEYESYCVLERNIPEGTDYEQ